eukprot:scaffold13397_cov183-Amphora_coffeaeformis.AAC.6
MKQLRFTSFSSIARVDQQPIPGVSDQNETQPSIEDSDSEPEYAEEDEEGAQWEAPSAEDDGPYTGEIDPPSTDEDPIEENSAAPDDEPAIEPDEESADDAYDGSIGDEEACLNPFRRRPICTTSGLTCAPTCTCSCAASLSEWPTRTTPQPGSPFGSKGSASLGRF